MAYHLQNTLYTSVSYLRGALPLKFKILTSEISHKVEQASYKFYLEIHSFNRLTEAESFCHDIEGQSFNDSF